MHPSVFLAALLPAIASAATVNVAVGANNAIAFSPNTITANVGDTVVFTFMSNNHSVYQSTFASPCTPIAAVAGSTPPIASGFFPVSNTAQLPTFSVNVTSTSPVWLYCAQVTHCQLGMVAAINPPTTGQTFSAFQAAALAAAPAATSCAAAASSTTFSTGGYYGAVLVTCSSAIKAGVGLFSIVAGALLTVFLA